MSNNEIIKRMIRSIIIVSMLSGLASAEFYTESAIADGTRPYQFNVTLSDATGTNNATNIFLNGHAGTNFSSVYFQDVDTGTNYNYCVADNTTGRTWVNITLNGTVRMYYGNTSRTSSANCTATFIQFAGPNSSSFISPLNVPFRDMVTEASVRPTAASHNLRWGLANTISVNDDYAFIQSVTASNNVFFENANENTPTQKSTSPSLSNGVQYNLKITNVTGTGMTGYVNDAIIGTVTTTNLPNENLGLFFLISSGTGVQNYSFVRYYSLPEPAFATWSEETVISYLQIYASNTVQQSDEVDHTITNSVTPVKMNEIILTEFYTGSARFVYSYTCSGVPDCDSSNYATFQLYKNDVPYGVLRTATINPNPTEQLSTEDFNFSEMPSGTSISVYGNTTSGAFRSGSVYYLRMEFDINYTASTPILLTPANGSVTSFNFPPQFTDVDFTWSTIGDSGYQIEIAEDSAFNLIEYAVTTTTASTTKSMDAGTHYWRVRTYNNGTPGTSWSNTFSFTLTESTPSINGTAINGVVFEYIGGVQTPISGASVYLTNSTYTTQAVTGSNGYFLFTGLDNTSTYSLYSIKQGYDNSQTFFVTPANNATTTVNLPMRIYISPYVPNFVFEKFIIRSLFDDPYPGVTVNIYVGSALNPSFTGTTDSMGQAVFQLVKDTYYRLELSGGGLPQTMTAYFYGKEEVYYITIASGFPTIGDQNEDINATLYVTQVNASFANLSLYFNDESNTTSVVNFYAQYYLNGTKVCADQTSGIYPVTLNCTVNTIGNLTYVFGWNATSSQYGFIQGADVVDFKANNASAQIPGLKEKLGTTMLNWISILSIIFVAGLFSVRSIKYGAVVVPMTAEILYWSGVFTISGTIIHISLVLGILAYLRLSENKVIK